MKRTVILGAVFLAAALVFVYMSFVRQAESITMTPEAEIAIAKMGNELTLSAATISGDGFGDTVVAQIRSGAPYDTGNFRLVEGKGILVWVDRSLRFRGRGIDLDIGFSHDGMIVYATNYPSGS